MSYALIFALFLMTGALALWVRLAPSDPAIWNIAVTDPSAPVAGPCADHVTKAPRGARATCLLPGTPTAVLARLNSIATAANRTHLLAGSPADGRITWVSRSRLMGFPDYITAEARPYQNGTRLDILSRQRFGTRDHGVNAARLRSWLKRL